MEEGKSRKENTRNYDLSKIKRDQQDTGKEYKYKGNRISYIARLLGGGHLIIYYMYFAQYKY